MVNRSHAQSGEAVARDTLRVWQSFWSVTGFQYQYGVEKGDVGMAGSNVKRLLEDDPAALREAKLFGRFQVPTFFGTIASAIMLGAGFARDDQDLKVAGVSVLAISLIFDHVGYKHLEKAARLHNRGRSSPAP